LISATHQNLAECVDQGKFRQDLYYRLNVIELRLPPLRERLDDIALLADTILAKLAPAGSKKAILTPAALQALCAYPFPGNVRELENILERALAFANHDAIEVADLALKTVGAEYAKSAEYAAAAPSPDTIAAPAEEARALSTAHAQPVEGECDLPASLPDYLDQVEGAMIRRALAKTQFNRTQAAELLGISFRQLRYRMQRLNIHEPD
jgi:two-component system response regulator PilR (NtrC family)